MSLRLVTLAQTARRTFTSVARVAADDFHGLKGTAYGKRELAEEATYIRKHEEQLRKLKGKTKVSKEGRFGTEREKR